MEFESEYKALIIITSAVTHSPTGRTGGDKPPLPLATNTERMEKYFME
jgi:hypothetical protein